MAELMEYKCPACGGALEFNSAIQKMKCPYCDSEYDVSAFVKKDESLNGEQKGGTSWTKNSGTWDAAETAGMRVYSCKSCGGEIIADETTGASSCPYCGNPVVMTGSFSGALKPDYIIPFQLDKKAAKAALLKHYEGKRLLPNIFKDQNHIDEIKGVYVPFWLFDADISANVQFEGVNIQRWRDKKYEYEKIDTYSVLREGRMQFYHVPADGSSQMPDDLMESIEPFDFNKAVSFQTAYLAGYLADKYDITAEENEERINARILRGAEEALQEDVRPHYTSSTVQNSYVNYHATNVKYALYPVWLLSTTFRGQNYLFAMNGQTGKFVGDLPVDKGKARRMLFGIAAVLALIATPIVSLLL